MKGTTVADDAVYELMVYGGILICLRLIHFSLHFLISLGVVQEPLQQNSTVWGLTRPVLNLGTLPARAG